MLPSAGDRRSVSVAATLVSIVVVRELWTMLWLLEQHSDLRTISQRRAVLVVAFFLAD
jgi:hypothetical protein